MRTSFLHLIPFGQRARISIAVASLAGLAAIGACADSAANSITGVKSPQKAVIQSDGLNNAGKVQLCVTGPPGEYFFRNSGFVAGGGGVTEENVPDGELYHVNAGSCLDVITRTVDSPVHPDPWSYVTVNYVHNTAGGVFNVVDCVNDAGIPEGAATPCDASSRSTSALMGFHHGTRIVYRFTLATPLFVVGDLEPHGIGANVYFWGSQWWKYNSLSGFGNDAVASFKGYASSADNVCGGTWTSRVGNSPPPPDGISESLAIIVTTKVEKSGPDLTGDIKEILIVHPDDGYGSSPGHEAWGQVTTISCSGQ